MADLVRHVEMLRLLEETEASRDDLMPNEKEMLAHLREKYATPGPGHFDDKICLEVILRNVAIRRAHGLTPAEAATRVIDLPHKSD